MNREVHAEICERSAGKLRLPTRLRVKEKPIKPLTPPPSTSVSSPEPPIGPSSGTTGSDFSNSSYPSGDIDPKIIVLSIVIFLALATPFFFLTKKKTPPQPKKKKPKKKVPRKKKKE